MPGGKTDLQATERSPLEKQTSHQFGCPGRFVSRARALGSVQRYNCRIPK
jgi:hypothetical protein